jgi:hypothetical protein
MVTLQFPKLHNALGKKLDKLKPNDPRRGITVLNSNAIVFRDDLCLVVNLEDYFMIDCNITDPQDIEEIESIMTFMHGKTFDKEFWKEISVGAEMSVRDGGMYLKNPKYSKDLHYKEEDFNLLTPMKMLQMLAKQGKGIISEISLPYISLKSIYDCMATDFKTDNIIFEFHSQDKPVRFTFRDRKHVYGYIIPDYDSAQESFKFDNLEAFMGDEFIKDMIDEMEAEQAPPPPVFRPQEPVSPDQVDMFGGDIRETDEQETE